MRVHIGVSFLHTHALQLADRLDFYVTNCHFRNRERLRTVMLKK